MTTFGIVNEFATVLPQFFNICHIFTETFSKIYGILVVQTQGVIEMLKKLMLFFTCVSLLALVACGGELDLGGESNTLEPRADGGNLDTDNENNETLYDFSIEMIDEQDLETLEGVIMLLNYAEARGGFVTEGIDLLFEFDQPIFDFTLIEIDIVDGIAVTTGLLAQIGDLSTGESFVLIDYHTQATTIPRSGFYFLDDDGNENWFTLHQSAMDGSIVWSPFEWSWEYGFFDLEAHIAELLEPDDDYVPHLVRQGETLFFISRLYGTTVENLQYYNDLGNGTEIAVGQILRLPLGSVADESILVNGYDQEDPGVEVEFVIEWLEDELDNFIEQDFLGWQREYGRDLVIKSGGVVREFFIIMIEPALGTDVPMITDETPLHFVRTFLPAQPLVLRAYFEQGHFPTRAFVFTDSDGSRRFFSFIECQQTGEFNIREFFPDDPPDWDDLDLQTAE